MNKKAVSIALLMCMIIIAVSLSFSLSGCQRKTDMPEDTIESFESAFNKYDANAMLNCLHPTYQQLVGKLMDLL